MKKENRQYVIVRNSDTRIMQNNRTGKEFYASMSWACRALEKQITNGQLPENKEVQGNLIHSWYTCYELEHYRKRIERFEIVKNLMTGEDVRQSVNTLLSCDPSSETYWSM